jgi:hypothetical protein
MVESNLVHPQKEKTFCEDKIKELDKEKAKLEKELKDSRKKGTYTVLISVQDADGEPVALVGADGKDYPEIKYACEGDNVASFMAQAAVFLKKVMGSKRNDTVRIGSLMHGIDKQIANYGKRIHRADIYLEELRRKQG